MSQADSTNSSTSCRPTRPSRRSRSARAARVDHHPVPGRAGEDENWGRRKLAFRIGKHAEGTYVLEVFKAPASSPRSWIAA